jgi:hypothetical protein
MHFLTQPPSQLPTNSAEEPKMFFLSSQFVLSHRSQYSALSNRYEFSPFGPNIARFFNTQRLFPPEPTEKGVILEE